MRKPPDSFQILQTLVLLLFLASGCSDEVTLPEADPLAPEVAERIAGRLAWLGYAVAIGPQGAGFLDNFLVTPRRGVGTYHNTAAGRSVQFRGCDLGGGMVVSGEGEVVWVGKDLATERGERFCDLDSCPDGFRWQGRLSVSLDGEAPFFVDDFSVRSIVDGNGPVLTPVSATVIVDGATIDVDDPLLYADIFRIRDLTIDSIPNPSGLLTALSTVDRARMSFQAGVDLSSLMLNEASEARADHVHDTPCGTTAVTFTDGIPHVEADWSDCLLRTGLIASGDFSLDLDLQLDAGLLVVTAAGPLTLGGGLPRVDLSGLEWRVELPPQLPGDVTITLYGTGAQGEQITFAETLYVDD